MSLSDSTRAVSSGGAVTMPVPQSFYEGMGGALAGGIITAIAAWWKRSAELKQLIQNERLELQKNALAGDTTLQVRLVDHTKELLQEDRERLGRMEDQMGMLREDLRVERELNIALRQDNAKLQEINRELQAECRTYMQQITSLSEQLADKGIVT